MAVEIFFNNIPNIVQEWIEGYPYPEYDSNDYFIYNESDGIIGLDTSSDKVRLDELTLEQAGPM